MTSRAEFIKKYVLDHRLTSFSIFTTFPPLLYVKRASITFLNELGNQGLYLTVSYINCAISRPIRLQYLKCIWDPALIISPLKLIHENPKSINRGIILPDSSRIYIQLSRLKSR